MPWKPLNPRASGFLGLLQLKNTGQNPVGLLEDVRPIMDMLPWYLLADARLDWRTLTGMDVTDNGFFAPNLNQFAVDVGRLEVPEGYMWYLHDATARIVTGLSDNNILNGSTTAVVMPAPSSTAHMVLADIVAIQQSYETPAEKQFSLPTLRDVWLPPGTRIGAFIGGVETTSGGSPASWSLTVSARYTPIPL